MQKLDLGFETFALRHNEQLTLHKERPIGAKTYLAIKLVPCEFPDGEVVANCGKSTVREGAPPVERLIITACLPTKEGWQWCHLSPNSKEAIGDFLMNVNVEKDKWVYIVIE